MRRLVVALAVGAVMVVGVPLVGSSPAYGGVGAGDNSGGTVTVGASAGASGAGTPGGTGSGSPVSTSGGGGGTVCTDTVLTLNNALGPPPGATLPGSWYSITCTDSGGASTTETLWISQGSAPAPVPPVAPYTVALDADRSLQLPRPALSFDPPLAAVVNLPTWLWIDPDLWHPFSVSATVGGVTATATAVPVSVAWDMGDGASLSCPGPGAVYRPALSPSAQQTDCAYTYTMSSAGQPSADGNPNDGSFAVTASVVWEVSWTATGAPGGGALPSVETSSTARLRVLQIESVNG